MQKICFLKKELIMMDKDNSDIEWTIVRMAVKGKLTAEEKQRFDQWYHASIENQIYFQRAQSFYETHPPSTEMDEENVLPALESFFSYAAQSRRKSSLRRIMAAASILLIVSLSVILAIQFDRNRQTLTEVTPAFPILPGKALAHLTIDGERILTLGLNDTLIDMSDFQTSIAVEAGRMNYRAGKKEADSRIRINKIETPTGGEFQIVLEDGTTVWLNAESTLEYPVPFPSDKREVFLSGEAYFDVAQLQDKPFVIKTNNMTVHAIGTSFNVSAYPDDPVEHTTLVSGVVRVNPVTYDEDLTWTLAPNQQFALHTTNMTSSIKTVNTSLYTAWIHGRFMFEDQDLEEIFKMLKRWYDVDVYYVKEEYKNELFTGELPRFENLDIILDMMNMVCRLSFEREGTTVVVK
jgi:transmembrane sensor